MNGCRMTDRDSRDCTPCWWACGAAGTAVAEACSTRAWANSSLSTVDGVLFRLPWGRPPPRPAGSPVQPRGLETLRGAGGGRPLYRDVSAGGGRAVHAGRHGPGPLVFALANPEPEVFAEELAEGRSWPPAAAISPTRSTTRFAFPAFSRVPWPPGPPM